MPHHVETITPEDDRRVAEFLAKAYADSRQHPHPETALREFLGYQVESVDNIVMEAVDRDDLNRPCQLCYSHLDIQSHTEWTRIRYRGHDMCEDCTGELEKPCTAALSPTTSRTNNSP